MTNDHLHWGTLIYNLTNQVRLLRMTDYNAMIILKNIAFEATGHLRDQSISLKMEEDKSEEFPIIIRFVCSFEHRNVKNLVVRVVPGMKTEETMELIMKDLKDSKLPNVFKNHNYDTLKIECHNQGAKSNNAVINISDDPSLVLNLGLTLQEQKIRSYTELSFFQNEDYIKYIQSSRELPKQ